MAGIISKFFGNLGQVERKVLTDYVLNIGAFKQGKKQYDMFVLMHNSPVVSPVGTIKDIAPRDYIEVHTEGTINAQLGGLSDYPVGVIKDYKILQKGALKGNIQGG
jgi:hypothetical protein